MNKTLKFMFDLDSKVAIYVPSTINVDKIIDNQDYVKSVIKELSLMFGGATATEACGGWVTASGNVVIEKVTIVYSFCKSDELKSNFVRIINICERIKKELGQEAVTLDINGQIKFI